MGGGGVGSFPHQGHSAKHPLTDGILVIDYIHKWGFAGLHIRTSTLVSNPITS